jgi:hypothetical protein
MPFLACIFAQPDTEDKKLRKDLTLEVLALKVPFGNKTTIRMKSRGRDD